MMIIIIIIIIIIILVSIIVKMSVVWSPFFQKNSYFIVDICNIPFTLEFNFKHIEIKEFMFNCLAENLFL